MDRTQIVIPAVELQRQREFTRQLAARFGGLGRAPAALVDTYGCQQNVHDSQRIMGMLRDMGFDFTGDPYEADIIVINTCAIR